MSQGSGSTVAEVMLSSPPDVAPAATYEHAARAGDFIFVAGQIARDEAGHWVGLGDAGAQARQVYRNIARVLAHMGASTRDVVKITTILVDRADGPAVTAERLAFFGDHRPPHTGIIITGLGSPEVRVEVEVVAYAPHQPSSGEARQAGDVGLRTRSGVIAPSRGAGSRER
jgi:2-iminobutanoate/2-iminopropanoate deaminase